MANVNLSISRTSPVSSFTRNKDFSDADLDRLMAAATVALRAQEIPNPTQNQIADYLFSRVVADFKNFTNNQEAATANTSRISIGL